MIQVAYFPSKYMQGPGAIDQLPELIIRLGRRALVLASPSAKQFLPADFSREPLASVTRQVVFGGECSEKELKKLAEEIMDHKATVVVGMGGGKTIDAAKIAADRASLPVIVVPTIASTDAPCSGCAVTYTPSGEFEKVHYQRLNPSAVLVDMNIMAQAPVRFLVSGMGDALATWFEARSCARTHSLNECGGHSTQSGLHLARLCYDLLLEHGLQAKNDNQAGLVTHALNCIVEANILLSGIGFESGGLASAHAIHNGLTALEETHAFYHGEKVAFGLLAGLHLIQAPTEEISEVYRFCHSVGLPVTLAELGISYTDAKGLKKVAEKSSEQGSSIHHEGAGIGPDKVYDALLRADAFGRRL